MFLVVCTRRPLPTANACHDIAVHVMHSVKSCYDIVWAHGVALQTFDNESLETLLLHHICSQPDRLEANVKQLKCKCVR